MAASSRPRAAGKIALGAALTAAAVAALRQKVARFEVVENSMQPALSPGDYLVALATALPRRNDIVVYPDPTRPDRDLVKRVVGLAGETVTIEGGQVAIDGKILAEAWADGPTLPDGEWRNPPDTVFLLGDNRPLSSGDSRATGPLRSAGMHRVILRYWPPGSFGQL